MPVNPPFHKVSSQGGADGHGNSASLTGAADMPGSAAAAESW